jgi:pimeloyl-ACP methyl ester carboxylesterase
MAAWSDGYWWSNDGLRLHYRDHAGDPARPPILCIPGLTRNARDFEGVARRLAGEWRVICVELRGRGESAYAKNPMSYVPLTYLEDIEALLRELDLKRVVLFGTSLGGLVAMLLSLAAPGRVAGTLLNDVGPDIDPRGLDRIRSYVGRSQSWPTWLHAARHFQESQRAIYPKWKLDQWIAFAKRLCRLNAQGRVVLDYDMRIAEPLKLPAPAAGFDLWPAFRSLAGAPLLSVRGALSDLLAPQTVERMQAQAAQMESVAVPSVGHAPTLDEPEAIEATHRLLARIDPPGASPRDSR